MIELKDVSIWQKSIGAISSFISEGNFRFSDQGVFFKATDPSQIVLVDYSIDKKVFEKYEVEPSFVGLDLVELHKIMSRAMPGDKLLFELNDSELNIKLEGDLSRTFKLPLIDVADAEIKIPEINSDAKIEINARILKEALKDASLFGSSVILKIDAGKFVIEARGSQGTLKTIAKGSKNIKVNSSNEVVAKYSLNFLQNIVREADPNQKIFLELKTDSPIKVSYKIGESTISFYLAHMIL